ncbi:tetratricopeptide repeat protein [Leptospira barantonii]|uniref:Tetratricopeptide repeat protein n=1 Tax=Leptospira barantonii TaxID=2023184 RepID=A0ABX4NK75_9LEPT|nr:hypothetical protein [Leptospira barantonii]PJZ57165.1 hypothetical protein CH367_10470 [Leptospira barantonii]
MKIILILIILIQFHCATIFGTVIGGKIDEDHGQTVGLISGFSTDVAISIYTGAKYGALYGLGYAGITVVSLPLIFFILMNPFGHGEPLEFPIYRDDDNGRYLRELFQNQKHFKVYPNLHEDKKRTTASDKEFKMKLLSGLTYSSHHFFEFDDIVRDQEKQYSIESVETITKNMQKFKKLFGQNFIFYIDATVNLSSCFTERVSNKAHLQSIKYNLTSYNYPENFQYTSYITTTGTIQLFLIDFKNSKTTRYDYQDSIKIYNEFGNKECPNQDEVKSYAFDHLGTKGGNLLFPKIKAIKHKFISKDPNEEVQELLLDGIEGISYGYQIKDISPKAKEKWTEALIKSNFKSEGAYANLAFYYLNKGFLREAIEMFTKAAELNGENQKYWKRKIETIQSILNAENQNLKKSQ